VEVNWSTFVLEFINFLVLVWLLKRFLYKPVLEIIEQRRAAIEATLAEAETRHSDAEKLQAHYETRVADWEQERQQSREALVRELEIEREHQLADLKTELALEREKSHAADARRQADSQRQMESTALEHGARFASRLLSLATGPELHTRLSANLNNCRSSASLRCAVASARFPMRSWSAAPISSRMLKAVNWNRR
jgi:F-type H+-transporting ATPase subunit b